MYPLRAAEPVFATLRISKLHYVAMYTGFVVQIFDSYLKYDVESQNFLQWGQAFECSPPHRTKLELVGRHLIRAFLVKCDSVGVRRAV